MPLFVKSELMLSYSWGGAPLYSHTYDYNGGGSKAGDLMGPSRIWRTSTA